MGQSEAMHAVDIWWIPLGAGGRFVAFNGRTYERIQARKEGRPPEPLFHTALEVHADRRYVIENAWPIPDPHGDQRGVVVEGPVFANALGRLRFLRYEVRRWADGTIFDAPYADAPQRLSQDPATARQVLRHVDQVPARIWGRKEPISGDMWNSNSVIAWILERSGLPAADMHPPGGRAPGWTAGIAQARHAAPARPAN